MAPRAGPAGPATVPLDAVGAEITPEEAAARIDAARARLRAQIAAPSDDDDPAPAAASPDA